jgi:hypothetical protein
MKNSICSIAMMLVMLSPSVWGQTKSYTHKGITQDLGQQIKAVLDPNATNADIAVYVRNARPLVYTPQDKKDFDLLFSLQTMKTDLDNDQEFLGKWSYNTEDCRAIAINGDHLKLDERRNYKEKCLVDAEQMKKSHETFLSLIAKTRIAYIALEHTYAQLSVDVGLTPEANLKNNIDLSLLVDRETAKYNEASDSINDCLTKWQEWTDNIVAEQSKHDAEFVDLKKQYDNCLTARGILITSLADAIADDVDHKPSKSAQLYVAKHPGLYSLQNNKDKNRLEYMPILTCGDLPVRMVFAPL